MQTNNSVCIHSLHTYIHMSWDFQQIFLKISIKCDKLKNVLTDFVEAHNSFPVSEIEIVHR